MDGYQPRTTAAPGDPEWMALAYADLGVREIAGPNDNPVIMAYYVDAGHPEVDHDEVAWCAAFVGAQLERSGVASSRSLMARAYLNWGKRCPLQRGAIAVFRRGRSPIYGHVGFVVGWDSRSVYVLSGNQGNAVSVAPFAHADMLDCRMPVTAGNSRTVRAAAVTAVGLAAGETGRVMTAAPELMQAADELRGLAYYAPALAAVGTALALAGIVWTLYARWRDLQDKGR